MAGTPRRRRANAAAGAGPRRHQLKLRLTDAENARLLAEAEVRQCSRQAVLMRALVSDGTEAVARLSAIEASLWSARRGVARAGANVNQAVKLEHTRRLEGVHGGGQFEEQLGSALAQLERAVTELTAALERLERER